MSFTVSCYTLFDITQTGTVNRNRPSLDEDENVWLYKRNTQCNFDTVLQAISLRSQPEILNRPTEIKIKFDEFDNFGFLFQQTDDEELYNATLWKNNQTNTLGYICVTNGTTKNTDIFSLFEEFQIDMFNKEIFNDKNKFYTNFKNKNIMIFHGVKN